jgi:hypothetical protein
VDEGEQNGRENRRGKEKGRMKKIRWERVTKRI